MNEVATPTNKSQYYTNGETVKRCNWCNVEVKEYKYIVNNKGFCGRVDANKYIDIKGGSHIARPYQCKKKGK